MQKIVSQIKIGINSLTLNKKKHNLGLQIIFNQDTHPLK